MFIITLGYIYIIVNNNITYAEWSDVVEIALPCECR